MGFNTMQGASTDVGDYKSPSEAVHIFLIVISTLVVIGRIVARGVGFKDFAMDDYMVLLGWVWPSYDSQLTD
jgi:hypothetical protein